MSAKDVIAMHLQLAIERIAALEYRCAVLEAHAAVAQANQEPRPQLSEVAAAEPVPARASVSDHVPEFLRDVIVPKQPLPRVDLRAA